MYHVSVLITVPFFLLLLGLHELRKKAFYFRCGVARGGGGFFYITCISRVG